MKFFPKDANKTERITIAAVLIFITALFLFMQLSAFGVFDNMYATACRVAGWGWKIPGLIFTGLLAFYIWLGVEDRVEMNVFVLFIIAVLSLAFYCGFSYPYNI